MSNEEKTTAATDEVLGELTRLRDALHAVNTDPHLYRHTTKLPGGLNVFFERNVPRPAFVVTARETGEHNKFREDYYPAGLYAIVHPAGGLSISKSGDASLHDAIAIYAAGWWIGARDVQPKPETERDSAPAPE